VHQIRFRPGLRPGPRSGRLQHPPDLLALVGLRGILLLRGGEGKGRKRIGRGGEGRKGLREGREREGEEGRKVETSPPSIPCC